ncbi:MAG: substrate-binding protein [Acetobacteraceae bacterium]
MPARPGLRSAVAAGTFALLLAMMAPCAARAADGTISIGVPVGLSGANSVTSPSLVQAARLAVAQINEKGGILGKKLVLDFADDQTSTSGAAKAFTSLVYGKHVDVLITAETSAARNAGMPIVNRSHTPYIYTSFYEGGACSPWLFIDAWVPVQAVSPTVDYFMKAKGAKTFFLVGNDYVYGRLLLGYTKKAIEAHGGKVVGEEYLPIADSNWAPIISRIKSSHAEALISATAGGEPNVTLAKQLQGAGIKILFANMSLDENTAKEIGPAAAGTYIIQSYLTSIDNPQNEAFQADLRKMFGKDAKVPNELSEPEYDGIYLYKAAVEKAHSTEPEKVVKELPLVTFDGPRGPVGMSDEHHAPLTMYLAQVQPDLSVKIVRKYPNVSPGNQCPNLK